MGAGDSLLPLPQEPLPRHSPAPARPHGGPALWLRLVPARLWVCLVWQGHSGQVCGDPRESQWHPQFPEATSHGLCCEAHIWTPAGKVPRSSPEGHPSPCPSLRSLPAHPSPSPSPLSSPSFFCPPPTGSCTWSLSHALSVTLPTSLSWVVCSQVLRQLRDPAGCGSLSSWIGPVHPSPTPWEVSGLCGWQGTSTRPVGATQSKCP